MVLKIQAKCQQTGFTLIELLITIAIVGILAAVALPSYQNHIRRSRYTEIVAAIAPYKLGISECMQEINTFTGCNGGSYSIPTNITKAEGGIASLTVKNGVIKVVPTAKNGILATDTLIATPSLTASNRLFWTFSGGAVKNKYVKQ